MPLICRGLIWFRTMLYSAFHLESSICDLEAILNPLLFMLIDGGIPLLPMETPYTTYLPQEEAELDHQIR